ncbi:beta-lactoglobulin-2 [Bos mutus]|uniref:beta-lactoglobulin-2 n=1 Tax=Bos mutus TaxID=72004 RepID=UPI0038B41A66
MQLKVPPQVAGMWHTVAMAASNMLLLDAESGPLRVENHECVEKTLMAQKTEDPAVFTVNCEWPSPGPACPRGSRGPHRALPNSLRARALGTRLPSSQPVGSPGPEMDDEAMEKFAGALASLLEHVQMVLGLRQGADLRAKVEAQEVGT